MQKKKLDTQNLSSAIRHTSFSCAPDFDEYPYSSIMFFVDKDKFNAQSSDKHRISVFGEKFAGQQSFLLSKNQAELSLNFLPKENAEYVIYKNKLVIFWDNGGFSTSLEANTHQSIYNSFSDFFTESKFVCSVTLEKSSVIKSLKFISSISSSSNFFIKIANKELILSSSKNDQGAVIDKIILDEKIDEIQASFLFNHFMKALDILMNDNIKIDFMDYRSYTICVMQTSNYSHLIFPFE